MTQAYQGSRSSFLRNSMVFALALFIFGLAATDGARAADPNLWTVTGGSNGSKAEGSNESSKSVGASKASNTVIGASTNSNPESGGAKVPWQGQKGQGQEG